MEPPCYGCQDRKLGCHDACEKYHDFRRFKMRQNKAWEKKRFGSIVTPETFKERNTK